MEKSPAGPPVNPPPLIFPGHRICIAPPQEPDLIRPFELLYRRGIPLDLADKELDCARVLLASLDQHFLLVALRLERYPGQVSIERDSDRRRQDEYQEQSKTPLSPHPEPSGVSGRVCRLL